MTKFPLAPGFCLCWHAAEASCSRCAGSEGLQTAASLRYTWAFLKQRLEGVNGLTLGFSQELLVWWKQSNLFSIVDLKLLNCWRNMGNFSDEVPVRFGSCSFTYCPSRQRNRHICSVIYLFLQKPSGLTNTVRPTLYVAVHLLDILSFKVHLFLVLDAEHVVTSESWVAFSCFHPHSSHFHISFHCVLTDEVKSAK